MAQNNTTCNVRIFNMAFNLDKYGNVFHDKYCILTDQSELNCNIDTDNPENLYINEMCFKKEDLKSLECNLVEPNYEIDENKTKPDVITMGIGNMHF